MGGMEMLHESGEKQEIQIIDSEITFEHVYQGDNIPLELQTEIKNADVLLLPYKDVRGTKGYCFPEQTFEFFDYLKKNAKLQDVGVDICISDEQYKELELHADVLNIAQIIVTCGVLPIVTGIISCYLYDKLKQRKTELNTNVTITVEQKGKSKTIHYDGKAECFESAMKSIQEHIFD